MNQKLALLRGSQSPPRIRGRRAMSHACVITTNGDGAAADSVSQSVLQMKVQLLFHSTGHSREGASARTADFRRWCEAGNKRIRWKSSPQSPWKITLILKCTHKEGQSFLHSLGDFTNTCFFVGWVLFPWLYWQGWMLCRAQHVFSVYGQEIQGGEQKHGAKHWWFLSFLTSDILLQRSGLLQGKIKKKFLWLQFYKDYVTTELQGLTLSARFKPTNNLTEA